ncbi:MAG: endolytic transglycosylase MltG [Deltaproteobacteria bacterium]|nr:endolytic transglycosylase MltG [Deltaproteobacteria bacterium]
MARSNIFISICRLVGWLAVICIPLGIIAGGSIFSVKDYLLEPIDAQSTEKIVVEVKPGTSFRSAAKLLEKEGLIKRWWSLEIISRLKRNNTIVAGEYELSKSMKPADILEKLLTGDILKRIVLFKEGTSVKELGKIVEAAGLGSNAEFTKTLFDPKIIESAGVGGGSFEGYLFPDTYHFTRPISARDIIWTMLERGEKIWADNPAYQEQAVQLGMSRHEILTLASIIEKESGNVDEQPFISSVFHNRLADGMRLESDPTAVYAIPGFSGKIYRKHIETITPYNTYQIDGLPPGPICSPGHSAIKAALYPAKSNYRYFVSDARGGHIFSVTLKEHNRAVQFYRRAIQSKEEQQLQPQQ